MLIGSIVKERSPVLDRKYFWGDGGKLFYSYKNNGFVNISANTTKINVLYEKKI